MPEQTYNEFWQFFDEEHVSLYGDGLEQVPQLPPEHGILQQPHLYNKLFQNR
ncbi:MAG: hypothetical protein QW757_03060 [Candidatus Woesearchaeota archaeon]